MKMSPSARRGRIDALASDPGGGTMTVTEYQEHTRTEEALQTLTTWAREVGTGGGENITFSLSRQGAPGDAFLAMGDCTPFTPQGSRGTLHGQPPGDTGAPIAYFTDFGIPPSVNQVPCTFSFDLNSGKVTLAGSFPGLPPSLEFSVEFDKRFDSAGGANILFHSGKTSDEAGYIITVELVGAS
jgi:hypothetical protein